MRYVIRYIHADSLVKSFNKVDGIEWTEILDPIGKALSFNSIEDAESFVLKHSSHPYSRGMEKGVAICKIPEIEDLKCDHWMSEQYIEKNSK